MKSNLRFAKPCALHAVFKTHMYLVSESSRSLGARALLQARAQVTLTLLQTRTQGLPMGRELRRPEERSPQVPQDASLVQAGVHPRRDEQPVQLRVLAPMHTVMHVVDRVVPIIAREEVDHRADEIPGAV